MKNTIGGRDRADFLRFNLNSRSSVQATLSKLKANANLALLNGAGQLVLQSKRKGKKNEAIATTLDAGSYFLKITPGSPQDQTKNRLQLSGAPLNCAPAPSLAANAAPVLAVNIPISLTKGTPAIFNANLLKATDAEQNSSQLVYTLNRLPEAGLLQLNGNRLKTGGTFTQADIDAGRLAYNSLGRNQQLTNNSTDDFDPQISGSNVAWYGSGGTDGGTDTEIFFFNGSTVTQLTTNSTSESDLQISGSNAVWRGSGGTDGGTDDEIFFFNGSTVTQLTTNSTFDFQPQISGSNVAWYGSGGTDGGTDDEIFFFNGSTVTQLTTNSTDDLAPQISGSNVAWNSILGGSYEVFFGNLAKNDNFDFTIADGVGGATNGTFNITLN